MVSFELAERLKQAGMPQGKTMFRYRNDGLVIRKGYESAHFTYLDAPTSDEIALMLPRSLYQTSPGFSWLVVRKVKNDHWFVSYEHTNSYVKNTQFSHKSLAESLGRALEFVLKRELPTHN